MRRPFEEVADARLKLESHSSQALPAPKPRPVKTGHDLRLKTRTEKITPKDAPRVLRMRRVLRQWSHFSFKRASLMGLLGRTAAAVMGAFVLESDIVIVVLGYWVRLRGS